MTPEELERQEAAVRDLIETLRQLSYHTQASPDFLSRVLAQAEALPTPRPGFRTWLTGALVWSTTMPARLAVAALLVLAVIGAVPQYITWFSAYLLGVPADGVYEARAQERLWQKNFACATQLDHNSSNYALITGEHVVVVTWACPSGDVLVTVESATDESFRRSIWIPLKMRRRTAQHFPWTVREAGAEQPFQQAAPMVEVLCQKWLPTHLIKRRIQLGNGHCVDEVLDPRTGRVVQRQPAPCERTC
jgi:hypothetical protein